MADQFDFVIVGAGLSGVLLASRLLQDAPAQARRADYPRILLVDRSFAGLGSTTLAYWSSQPTVLDRWQVGSWQWLRVVGHDDRVRNLELDGLRYRAVSWNAARTDLLGRLGSDPRVTLVEAAVDEVRDGPYSAHARIGQGWVSGGFVFDSRPAGGDATAGGGSGSRRALTLYQSFRGIWVRTDQVAVDTATATLLDFTVDDGRDLGFASVLPIDGQSALVTAVRIGVTPDLPDPAPAVPRELGQDGWRVVGEECGVTELLTPPPKRRHGARVLAIGQRGGRVRPSTGYAVTRILADTDAIVASLRSHGHPFAIPPDPRRDKALDAIWLHALATHRADLEPAFLALFAGVPTGSVLRFLDGRSSTRDLLRVVSVLPRGPFLRSAARLSLGRPPEPSAGLG